MAKLYPEDQQRVEEYLAASVHQVERKAFSPLKLLAGLAVVLVLLTGVSVWVAWDHGIV